MDTSFFDKLLQQYSSSIEANQVLTEDVTENDFLKNLSGRNSPSHVPCLDNIDALAKNLLDALHGTPLPVQPIPVQSNDGSKLSFMDWDDFDLSQISDSRDQTFDEIIVDQEFKNNSSPSTVAHPLFEVDSSKECASDSNMTDNIPTLMSLDEITSEWGPPFLTEEEIPFGLDPNIPCQVNYEEIPQPPLKKRSETPVTRKASERLRAGFFGEKSGPCKRELEAKDEASKKRRKVSSEAEPSAVLPAEHSAVLPAEPKDDPKPVKMVGIYTPEARRARIARFMAKRHKRIWTKRVKYDVRKNFADTRLRVKGRFVKKEDEELLRELMQIT